MNTKYCASFFAAIIAVSFNATAEQVYENVDKEGAVEFSDQASPSAKAIDVKPNVIDVTPVAPIESSPTATQDNPPATDGDTELEVTHQGVADDYDDELARRRAEARRVGVEPAKHDAGAAPVHDEAVHEGGRHR